MVSDGGLVIEGVVHVHYDRVRREHFIYFLITRIVEMGENVWKISV